MQSACGLSLKWLFITDGLLIMNEKLHIPRFRYLTQNHDGAVRCHITYPREDLLAGEHISDHMIKVSDGARNPEWRNFVIDLDAVNAGCAGYTFENGILKPVD